MAPGLPGASPDPGSANGPAQPGDASVASGGEGSVASGGDGSVSSDTDASVSSDNDAGVAQCYRCSGSNLYTATGACTLDQVPIGAGCPSGYTTTVPDCRPCHLQYAPEGWCTGSTAACGTFTSNGVVGAGALCYSCSGSASDFDPAVAKTKAEASAKVGCPYPNSTVKYSCGNYEWSYISGCGGTCL
jgi:hypothetical protein